MKKILLVDDHPLMRKGLALTLETEVDLTIQGPDWGDRQMDALIGYLQEEVLDGG